MKSEPTQTAVQLALTHTPLPTENNTSRLFWDIILNLQTEETSYDHLQWLKWFDDLYYYNQQVFMVYSSQLHKRPVFGDEHLAHGRRVPSSGNINMKIGNRILYQLYFNSET